MNEIEQYLFKNEPKLWNLKKKIEARICANETMAFPGFAGITNTLQWVLDEIESRAKGEIANKTFDSEPE